MQTTKKFHSFNAIWLTFLFIGLIILAIPVTSLAGIYYVDDALGSDKNPGSNSLPWKTFEHGVGQLSAGDTLYVRAGTYYEASIKIDVSGTDSQRIKIMNYPGDKPLIDGGLMEFRTAPNKDWELYDRAKNIYRSVKTYSGAGIVHGYISHSEGQSHLVAYEEYGHFSSDNEDYTKTGSIYVGPGVYWNNGDQRIYIRLQHSEQEEAMGYNIPENIDPRQNSIVIVPQGSVVKFGGNASYLTIKGIDFKYRNNALKFAPGSHHITIKKASLLGGRTHVYMDSDNYDVIFNRITIDDSFPPWVAYSDVKIKPKPAHQLQEGGLRLGSGSDIKVLNSLFNNISDAISIGGHDVLIRGNEFNGIRDDAITISSSAYNVEIARNNLIYVSKAISFNGNSGTSDFPGTKYIHHNVMDCTEPMLSGRNDPDNLLPAKRHGPYGDGMVWNRTFAKHGGRDVLDPWKIYNNTILIGKVLGGLGAEYEYSGSVFDPDIPQEFYNNIVIQTMDHWVSKGARIADGSFVSDGNLFFRSDSSASEPLFAKWDNNDVTRNFKSVAQFQSSSFFEDSKTVYRSGLEQASIEGDPGLDDQYYPDPYGPAASGSVDISQKGWPGARASEYRGALKP